MKIKFIDILAITAGLTLIGCVKDDHQSVIPSTTRDTGADESWRCSDKSALERIAATAPALPAVGSDYIAFSQGMRNHSAHFRNEFARSQEVCGHTRHADAIQQYDQGIRFIDQDIADARRSRSQRAGQGIAGLATAIGATATVVSTVRGGQTTPSPAIISSPTSPRSTISGQRTCREPDSTCTRESMTPAQFNQCIRLPICRYR